MIQKIIQTRERQLSSNSNVTEILTFSKLRKIDNQLLLNQPNPFPFSSSTISRFITTPIRTVYKSLLGKSLDKQ